ncbi:MAG: alpha/beta hydrolase [Proteobacteria bacterium]|nr:alpha/beta hydrolase [Pseudomonadota bacterium]MBI3499547.1 alpha/beta hydrolase [Pseudomonadota bacterium]
MSTMEWTLDRSFDYEGDTIRYRVMGTGPDLVLVHGTPFSSYVWHRIAREAGRTWRIHVYDLLGYGQSTRREGQDVSLAVQDKVLAALLAHWRLDRPAIVGHDFGGATVLRAHLLDGCDFNRILLIDPVAIRPWGSPFVRHVRDHEAAFQGIPAYIHEAMVARYLRGTMARQISDAELAPYLSPWLGPVGQPAFYRQIGQMDERFTDEVEARLDTIRCPLSILWGEDDGWIPVAQGARLQRMVPGSRLRIVPKAGHLLQEDAPEAVVAAIYDLGV